MSTIIIQENKTIKEIQQDFNSKFPHLRIEFYSKEHETGEATSNKAKFDENLKLSEIRTVHNEGEISINGHLKTSTLEENFSKLFGVNVQVFRKSGRIWLQTTTTDDWTLAEQEQKGVEYELN